MTIVRRKTTSLRIISWNVNSVRARLPLIERLVGDYQPDILCLQETKAQDAVFPLKFFRKLGYGEAFLKGQKSYNGVAILSKVELSGGESQDWCGKGDARHMAASLEGDVRLHNFYVPAGGEVPDAELNDKFRHKLDFLDQMADWSAALKEPSIIVGDLNVAPAEADVWSPKALKNVVSFTEIERRKLRDIFEAHGWIDAHRHFCPEPEKLYSWWSYRSKDWTVNNRGRRLDHIWISPALEGHLLDARILTGVRSWQRPSDHAPLLVDLSL